MSPSPLPSAQRAGRARTGAIGAIVVAVAFFDGLVLGLPIAILAGSAESLIAFIAATIAVIFVAIACCRWVDQRWDEWFSNNTGRIESRLERMRASRLMRHPVEWIQRGPDRWYALASALANPVLVVALTRSISGKPVGERRIVLGSVAYAIPYVALWSLVGLALANAIGSV